MLATADVGAETNDKRRARDFQQTLKSEPVRPYGVKGVQLVRIVDSDQVEIGEAAVNDIDISNQFGCDVAVRRFLEVAEPRAVSNELIEPVRIDWGRCDRSSRRAVICSGA